MRLLEAKVNNGDPLPDNTIIATIDVCGLYTNIPIDEEIEAVKEALEEREEKNISTEFLIRLLELVLKYNIFEFDSQIY